uniref:Uncharacterized protein n=1 Tax=Gasterosteus aculeatus aculeatus TaxID=481459 RepID=A0AAQ4S5X1_GASAC
MGEIKSPAHALHSPSPSGRPLGTVGADAMKKEGTLRHFQVERSLSPFAGLDIGLIGGDRTGSGGRGIRAVQEEPLDAILSPELDKMVADGAILSKLYNIPELEGKDVEEVFTAVLSPNRSINQHSEQSQRTQTAVGTTTTFPRLPLMNGLTGAPSHFPNTPMISSGAQSPTGFRVPPLDSTAPGLAS